MTQASKIAGGGINVKNVNYGFKKSIVFDRFRYDVMSQHLFPCFWLLIPACICDDLLGRYQTIRVALTMRRVAQARRLSELRERPHSSLHPNTHNAPRLPPHIRTLLLGEVSNPKVSSQLEEKLLSDVYPRAVSWIPRLLYVTLLVIGVK